MWLSRALVDLELVDVIVIFHILLQFKSLLDLMSQISWQIHVNLVCQLSDCDILCGLSLCWYSFTPLLPWVHLHSHIIPTLLLLCVQKVSHCSKACLVVTVCSTNRIVDPSIGVLNRSNMWCRCCEDSGHWSHNIQQVSSVDIQLVPIGWRQVPRQQCQS